MNPHATTESLLINPRELARLLGVSLRGLYNEIARDRTFPASIRLGRSRRWSRREIETWIESKATRDVPPRRNRRTAHTA